MIALLSRDLMLAFRAGGGFGLAIAFFLIVTVMVPFSVGPQPTLLATIAPGVLWLGALLACLLSLDRLFALDWERQSRLKRWSASKPSPIGSPPACRWYWRHRCWGCC